MKKKTLNYLGAIVGFLLLATGLILLKMLHNPEGVLLVLPSILIGLGCGTFGHSVGNIITNKITKHHPEYQKQINIEKKDERNIAISNQAKAKAYDSMIFTFGVLMIVFALMNVDMVAILLLVIAYLLITSFFIYYFNKYQKEM